LPGTGIQLSKVALGSSTFGDQLDEKASFEIIDAALDMGINMIDTGDVYCGGESERIIGKFMKGRRDKALIGTKMYLPTGPDVNDRGASRHHMLRALEDSLRRLQTDYVDIYYIHHPDRITPMEETLETFDALVKSGKVRYVGFSNYSAWESCDLLWTARHNRLIPPVLAQNVYNLITRGLEDEMACFLQKHRVGLAIYNPLAGGLLTGKHKRDHLLENTRYASQMYRDRYCSDSNFDAIEALTEIAESAGMTLLEMSLRWSISHSYVSCVLMGFSKTEQLVQNLGIVEKGALNAEIMTACDKVWSKLKGTSAFGYFIPQKDAVGVTYTGTLK